MLSHLRRHLGLPSRQKARRSIQPEGSASVGQPLKTERTHQDFDLDVVFEGKDPVVDIVAVHGINGHRHKTWRAKNQVHWLRDLLPDDIPHARIMCWGYDSKTHNGSRVSHQYIHDHARTLVSHLSLKRSLDHSTRRPIVFIAHSLGGIIVKSALIYSQGASLEHRSVKLSTYGIMFMGTPHQGANGVQLWQLLINVTSIFIAADDRLIKHLKHDSEWLQQQLEQYGQISGEFVTKFAYEEYKTPTPFGHKMVVPRSSAVVPGQADAEAIVIHADHVNMVKFLSSEDTNYRIILPHLQMMVRDAGDKVQSRWEEEARVSKARSNETCCFILSKRNTDFTGRCDELDELRRKFFEHGCSSVAVLGLGGMGKTQLALEFAFRIRGKKPQYSIFWFSALSKEVFEQRCVNMIAELHIQKNNEDEDPKELVQQYLNSKASGPWLLVIDNADDKTVLFGTSNNRNGIAKYFPDREDGLILFTTRSREVAHDLAGRNMVELKEMGRQEAAGLVQKKLEGLSPENQFSDEEMGELLEELTFLPLAIIQATAYMFKKRVSAPRYLELLRKTDKDMVDLLSREFSEGPPYNKMNAVATTWLVTFEQIRGSDPAATAILCFLYFIECKAIPQSILPHPNLESQLEDAIGTLVGYSFLARQGAKDVFDMHRLVHVAIGVWLEKRDKIPRVMDAVKHLVTIFLRPIQKIADYGDNISHMLSVSFREVRNIRSEKHRRFREAVIYLGGAYEWRKDHLAEESDVLLQTEHELASAYIDDRQLKKAIDMLEHVVQVQKQKLVEDDPSRLASEHELARAYLDNRQTRNAISMFERVVELRKKTLAEDDYSLLSSEHELARAYIDERQIEKAIEMLEHVVKRRRQVLPEDDNSRLQSEHELARAYLNNKQVKEGIKIFRDIVKMRERTLAEFDYCRLWSEHELARALLDDHQVEEAIEIFEYVVKMRKQNLEESDYSRLTSEHELARAYLSDRQIGKAIDLFEEVNMMRQKLPQDDPSRLWTEHELALAYLKNKENEKAIKLFKHVVERRQMLAEDDFSRLQSEYELSEAYLIDGQAEQGIKLLHHVVSVRKRLPETNDFRLTAEKALKRAFNAYEE